MKSVHVTGMGVACGLGMSIDKLWSSIIQGQSSIQALDVDESFRSRVGSLVESDQLILPSGHGLNMYPEPAIRYAIHAANQAIMDAGILDRGIDPSRIGVIISTGIGGIQTIENYHNILNSKGPKRISPYFVPNAIANASSGLISMIYGFHGMNTSVSSACSSSTQAIGLALRLIQAGDMDVCIVGGTEHATTPCSLAGFGAQRALSARNNDPKGACRPWDKDRDGFVIGNGASVLVLENEETASSSPQSYARVADIGWSSDAYHSVKPDPSGKGAKLSMQRAMKSLPNIDSVDYINAHATGTPIGDLIELNVVRDIWPSSYEQIHMSSTKSMHGHLLGAAGSIEAIITVLAMNHSIVPPTINCPNPEVSDINLVTHGLERKNIKYALSNSFGFGGTNATLLFEKL